MSFAEAFARSERGAVNGACLVFALRQLSKRLKEYITWSNQLIWAGPLPNAFLARISKSFAHPNCMSRLPASYRADGVFKRIMNLLLLTLHSADNLFRNYGFLR
jgi:hypothetical protein